MKIFVICFSLCGNTKKNVQAIHDEVIDLGHESVLESLDKFAMIDAA